MTYLGPSYSVTLDGPASRIRGEANEVSQDWLNKWRVRLDPANWLIEGDKETPSVDEGNDGIPDAGWNRKDILDWLASNNVKPNGYTAKGRALELVAEFLNPAPVEEQIQVEEAPVEEHSQGDDE